MSEINLTEMARKLEVSYNRIDSCIRKELNLEPFVPFKEIVKKYKQKNDWWRDDEFLRLIASIRNILVHHKRDTGYIVMPSEELVEELRRVEKRLTKPMKVIPHFKRHVDTVSVVDPLSSVLEKVVKHSYSQFPVMNGSKYAGLITENSITRWLANIWKSSGAVVSLDEAIVSDVLRYEEKRRSWMFVSRSASIDQIVWYFSKNEALEAALIEDKTEKQRRLLGIVTRWDVAQLRQDASGRELL